jgi:hypothetical protein
MDSSVFASLIPSMISEVTAPNMILVGSIFVVNLKAKFFKKTVEFFEKYYDIEIADSELVGILAMFGLFYLYTRNFMLSFTISISLIAITLLLIIITGRKMVSYVDSNGKKQYYLTKITKPSDIVKL